MKKEKKFKITADQLMQLENGFTLPKLQKWFPEVFVKKLEIGKWYKNATPCLFFCTGLNLKNQPLGYGFSDTWRWLEDSDYEWDHEGIKEAIEQEVLEVLKNEAVKRGFEVGSVFTPVGSDYRFEVCEGEIEICKTMSPGSFGLQFGDGNGLIMKDGIWASVYKKV